MFSDYIVYNLGENQMALKDKLNQLKTFMVGAALTSTTLTGCVNNKQQEKTPVQDMLSIDAVEDVDIYGNAVKLHKVNIPIYTDKNMKEDGIMQLAWGLDNNETISKKRLNMPTHPEEYDLPDGDTFVVEVYEDGVLKANNSLIIINRKIQVIGDAAHYQANLKRRAADLQEQANQAKRRKLERIRAEERANASKRKTVAKVEAKELTDSTGTATADTSNVSVTVKEHDVQKTHTDSLPADTIKRLKNYMERE